ncbi:MAG: hypothetical protein MUC28_00185 [Planctomycetes bacterium]|jgi:hypothetical protein|nr:hypothetical protein [Planctomycetota bacterium]
MTIKILFKNFSVLLLIWLCPLFAEAATLYLEPGDGTYGPGDSISLDIKLDIDGQCVNTVEADILFPREYLNVADFLIGDSILNLWVDRPQEESIQIANKEGSLHLAGGIPGGYCGRIPGDPGLSNIVGRIIFIVPSLIVSDAKPDILKIDFSPATRVLLNDGRGTPDRLFKKGAEFNFSAARINSEDRWQDQIREDDIPPEPFMVELQNNPKMFDGRYFINFFTVDKQSGLDRYEVLEIRPGEEIGVKPAADLWGQWLGHERLAPAWQRAEIPYPLLDQDLKSIIRVKAVDKAGNERIVEYIPPGVAENQAAQPANENFLPVIIGLAVAIFIIAAIFITAIFLKIKKKRNNKKYEEENNRHQYK